MLRDRIAARSFPEEPVIVTGDFNVGEKNPALHTLVGSPDSPGPFVDTFRVLHPDETEVGTYTGFKYGTVSGDKIDYILVQPGTDVLGAEIVRTSRGERYPSDHFPVTARVRLPAAEREH
jgi:endonuclease/exonuclease/phosphatase family metal-dependent hydrolase